MQGGTQREYNATDPEGAVNPRWTIAVTAGTPRRRVAGGQTHLVFGPEFHTWLSPDGGEFGILVGEGRDKEDATVIREGKGG